MVIICLIISINAKIIKLPACRLLIIMGCLRKMACMAVKIMHLDHLINGGLVHQVLPKV